MFLCASVHLQLQHNLESFRNVQQSKKNLYQCKIWILLGGEIIEDLFKFIHIHYIYYSHVLFLQVMMGYSHCLVIARLDTEQEQERLKRLPEYNPRTI